MLIGGLLLLWLPLCIWGAGITVKQAALEKVDGTYNLNAQFDIQLNPTLLDALNKGVPLSFLMEFEVIRPRAYWYDEDIVSLKQNVRLSYLTLTRQYQLSVAALHKSFNSLQEALQELNTLREWPVLGMGSVVEGRDYVASLRMKIDLAQLPGPLQVNAFGSEDWSLDSDWYRWTFTAQGT